MAENKENKRKCYKCGSSPTVNPDIKLFRFPKPGKTNIFRCELWAKFCFPDKEWSSSEFQHKIHNEHRMLCNRHFKETSFSDYPLSSTKLHRFAVPEEIESMPALAYQPGPSQVLSVLSDKTNVQQATVSQVIASPVVPAVVQPAVLPPAVVLPAVVPCAVVPPAVLPSPVVQPAVVSPEIVQPAIVPSPVVQPAVVSPAIVQPAVVPSPIVQPANVPPTIVSPSVGPSATKKKPAAAMTDKTRRYYLKSRKYLRTICQLRNAIKRLKKKKVLKILNEDDSVMNLLKYLSPSFALLLQSQLTNFKRKPKGRRWSMEEKILALRLYKRSPTGYRLLRRLFCLPSSSSLKKLLGEFSLQPGISEKVLRTLKKFSDGQKPSDKEFVLMFDEMSIKKHLKYNRKDDKIEGYQDHAKHGRSQQEATKALVFMLAGIRKKVKQPLAYYLSSAYVTADRLSVLIKEILGKCFEFGLHISAMVCDMDGVNRRAMTNLGASQESPIVKIHGREIITMFDTPHLLKCFRNMFMKYDIKCSTDISSNETCGEGLAKWNHIKQFHEIDSMNPNFVFAPSLKKEHLDPNTKQKMKVNLAAQVLSHTVACGIYSKVSGGELPAEASVTANVLSNLDKLFDCLNSDSPDLRRGKPYATNMTNTSPHLEFFRKMKRFFNEMEFVGCSRPPPSQQGWIWNMNAMELLWRKMDEYPDVGSLATRRLQQDPLENLFGCIRGNCGSNTNPTAGQFVAGMKTAIMSNLTQITSGNCEADVNSAITENFKTLLEPSTLICANDSPLIPLLQSAVNLTDIEETCIDETGEMQACAYVCGFLIKNHNKVSDCTVCAKILQVSANEATNLHSFVQNKEYNNFKTSLQYASRDLVQCVEKCALIINLTITEDASKNNLKRHTISTIKDEVFNFLKTCPLHYNANKNYITHSVFHICVNRFCTVQNRKFSEAASAAALKKKINILQNR